MRKTVRYADINAAGIVGSWQDLADKIKNFGFPAGFKPSPQTRLWWQDEVEAWVEAHPIDPNEIHDNPNLQKARAARAAKRAAVKREVADNA